MSSRGTSIFFALIFFGSHVHAEIVDPLRADLVRSGDSYLNKEMNAEDFITKARALKQSQPFNDDERSYLMDITEKMPESLRTFVCPTFDDGLCAAQPVSLANSTLAEASKAVDERPLSAESLHTESSALPAPPQMGEHSSKFLLFAVSIGLVLIAGSAAMRGKAIQIQWR